MGFTRKFLGNKNRKFDSISESEFKQAKVLVIFKERSIADLWNKEILGQISDGAWENIGNKGNQELWGDSITLLGNNNVILTRTNNKFYIPGDIYEKLDVVLDRMMEIMRTTSPDVVKRACHIIQAMIRYPRPPKDTENLASLYTKYDGKISIDLRRVDEKGFNVILVQYKGKFYIQMYEGGWESTPVLSDKMLSQLKDLRAASNYGTPEQTINEMMSKGITEVDLWVDPKVFELYFSSRAVASKKNYHERLSDGVLDSDIAAIEITALRGGVEVQFSTLKLAIKELLESPDPLREIAILRAKYGMSIVNAKTLVSMVKSYKRK